MQMWYDIHAVGPALLVPFCQVAGFKGGFYVTMALTMTGRSGDGCRRRY